MKKRVLAILLALALTVSAAACGADEKGSSAKSGTDTSTAQSSGTESQAETGSAGWTASTDVEADAPAGETDDRAFYKFPETVEVHYGYQIDPADTTLPEGDKVDDNQYTRELLEKYNIKVVCDWTAGNVADFQQKLSLQIASGDLPDAVIAPNRNYLVQAAKAGLTADLHDAFDKYASKQVKEIVESTGGRAITNGTYDDVFVGLPNITVDTDGVHIYFIRQDWLDELGLEVPKTVSDLEAAAKKFMEAGKSPKYAIAGKGNSGRTYANFLESSNNSYGFDPVYQAMNATPGYFLRDDSGKLYYGTCTDEMKASLEVLAKWYQEGLINPELGISSNGDEAAGVKDGSCGIFMGPWWGLGYGNGDSFKNDPHADWQSYPLYTDDGEWNVHMKDVGVTYTMCAEGTSADVQRAVVQMNSIFVRDESIFDTSVAIGWYPLRNTMAAADETEVEYERLFQVLRGEADPEEFNVPGSLYKLLYSDAKTLYEVISKDYDPSTQLGIEDMDVLTNNGQFSRFYALLIGNRPYATTVPTNKIYSELYYTIDGMEQYWSQLQDMEDQTIMSIITGKADISEFDTFVQNWHDQGGDEILKLVDDFTAKG